MRKRILIVSQHTAVLCIFSDELVHAGYDVKMLNRADQIIKTMSEYQPHLLIVCTTLSGINGHTLCGAIRAIDNLGNIPVILLSGNPNAVPELESKPIHANCFVLPYHVSYTLQYISRQLAA